MKLYDISQELFSCVVYPGDTPPAKRAVLRIANGDACNLSDLSMCAHNGTHIDAPFHFIEEGRTVEALPLEQTVGLSYVASCEGRLTAHDADRILETAKQTHPEAARRILLKGEAIVTAEAARRFAAAEVLLVGVESQSVGEPGHPMEVHTILLGAGVVLLEGIRLSAVTDGAYLLSAAPISLAGCDGAPCRAILMEL